MNDQPITRIGYSEHLSEPQPAPEGTVERGRERNTPNCSSAMYSSADFDTLEKTNSPSKGWSWGFALNVFYAFIQTGLKDKIIWRVIKVQWEQLLFWRVLALFQRTFMHSVPESLLSPWSCIFSLQWWFWKRLGMWWIQEHPWAHWSEHFLGKWVKRNRHPLAKPEEGKKLCFSSPG